MWLQLRTIRVLLKNKLVSIKGPTGLDWLPLHFREKTNWARKIVRTNVGFKDWGNANKSDAESSKFD